MWTTKARLDCLFRVRYSKEDAEDVGRDGGSLFEMCVRYIVST